MKALSIKQPWANLIASGLKTIETRLWGTSYRGELLIVSSKKPRIEPSGCAIALAQLIDCRPMLRSDERAAQCKLYENAIAWVLQDIRPLRPVRVKGQLGLFDVEISESSLVIQATFTFPQNTLFD